MLKQRMGKGALALPPTLLMTDEARLPDPLAAARRQPRGGGIVLRNYGDPYRDELAVELRRIAKAQNLTFLIAGDPAMALRLGADGCHLPEHLHHLIPRAKMAKPGFLVTAAAHSLRAVLAAEGLGADAALASPIFATKSHPDAWPLGPLTLAAWAYRTDLPLYALGGIDEVSAQRLSGIPLAGLAGIGGF